MGLGFCYNFVRIAAIIDFNSSPKVAKYNEKLQVPEEDVH
jgi:hypothetical protein